MSRSSPQQKKRSGKTPPTSPTLDAMRTLRPSGDRSFEELIARLLSRLSGERIRLCTSGLQGGVDALAEIPFAIEDKRYAGSLRSRDLQGGLTKAAIAHPDLQLWVLAATCAVGAQTYKDLIQAGLQQGIGLLVLDTATADPDLPHVSALAALAATDVDTTLEVLGDRTWRTRRAPPDLRRVRRELTAIRKLARFDDWQARLRRELRELPTWSHLVQRHNARLRSLILGDARNAFGTPYHPDDAVPRSVEDEITAWWQLCATAEPREVAVVTGDRYDGKTWLVYRWLSEALPRFTVPVFLFSSTDVRAVHGDIETLIVRQCEKALGPFARHATNILGRHRARVSGSGAWALIILDGANEYVAMPEALAHAVLAAAPPATRSLKADADGNIRRRGTNTAEDDRTNDARSSGLLVTCRARDFEDDASWVGSRTVRRIELGPYSPEEFRRALERRGLVPEQLADLPAPALEMIHRPRYLDLMLAHQEDIGVFGGVTVDVLHYLDASDKVASHQTTVRRDPRAFKAFLALLANRWLERRRLTYATVWRDLQDVTDQIEQTLHALISEGVLTERPDDTFSPDLGRLALGMGLFIRQQLLDSSDSALDQRLADLLEPHRDDDEKVRWLRAAVTVSLLGGDVENHPQIIETLLGAWLSSRNFSRQDLEDLRTLAPRLLLPFLALIEAFDGRAEAVLSFAEPILTAGMAVNEAAVARSLRRACRVVAVGSPRYIGDAGVTADVLVEKIGDATLADLGLTVPMNTRWEALRGYQRLGLFLATKRPSLLGPDDVLALLAGRSVGGDHLGEGERFAVRIILLEADSDWFVQEVDRCAAQPMAARTTVLRQMLRAADRGDLRELLARLPKSTDRWSNELSASELKDFTPHGNEGATLRLAERARSVALDPNSPRPPRAWLTAVGAAAVSRFEGSATLRGLASTSLDDFDLENVEPVLAAWIPAAGARIWQAFIADIPRRVAAKEESWSWALEGHAALLTPADRRMLLELVHRAPNDDELQHAFQIAYCCILAGAAPAQRLRLLLDHPFDNEWTMLYEITAAPAEESLRQATLAIIRSERSPRRLQRARYLLGYLGVTLTAADLAQLTGELAQDHTDREAANAADFLLRNAAVVGETAPAGAFAPLVQAPESVTDAAWQYSAFLEGERRTGTLTIIGTARALAAPETARRRGAAAGTPDDVAVAAGISLLAAEVRECLAGSIETPGFDPEEQFPETLVDALSASEFDDWIRLLVAAPPRTRHAHAGVLMATVPRALRTRHSAARDLWTLAYPFQRARFAMGTRFTVKGGLDWTLRLIHQPDLDDELATSLLRDLIADCRSDSELVSVALGARLASTTRLPAIVTDLLTSPNPESRARARFLVAWMPADEKLRTYLSLPDSSQWVERIGRYATQRLDKEQWAREWLRRFLNGRDRAKRWAAGRLFIDCSDAATPFWAEDMLYESAEPRPAIRRAEARLLLQQVRAKPDDSALRDKFLGHRVRELVAVVPPWREATHWDNVERRKN